MLQLADLGSVPVAFIFPRAFIAPFEEAAPLLCPSCGVPAPGIPRGRREDGDRPLTAVRDHAACLSPSPLYSLYSEQLYLFFECSGREVCTSVP